MVSGVHAPLTSIGFRRDVRLFFTILVGFLVFLIFALLLLLNDNVERADGTIRRTEETVADIATDAVNRAGADAASISGELGFLRARFGIAGAEIAGRDGSRVVSGDTRGTFDSVSRLTGHGTLTLHFDAAERRAVHRRFWITAAICVLAASLGAMLLLFYLPRVTRPIEEMLDDAKALGERSAGQEETSYLIDTFRKSIATMRSQADELERLHDVEKTRADDLERVTAALTRSLTSGLVAIDAAGNVLDLNAAGREILGVDAAASVAGMPIESAVPLATFAAALRDAFEQQSAVTRVEIDDKRGGEPITIGLTTVPLRNEPGDFLGFLALFTDLTPIRSLEARVQEMQTLAQLGEISAGIAHEFRSSLNTILGYMKLARRGSVDDVAETRLQSAEKEASLLLQAIERLLAFARPVQLHAERVELDALCREQAEPLREIAPDVHVSIEGPPVEIEGDRVLLARAIENLLRNAVEAIRQKGDGGGSIRIILGEQPACVTIIDDGIGFDPEETPRLFLPFHSNKPNGFGMGLPLAKKIVLLHGGTLRLQGEPGKGAVATMEFAA